MFSFLRDLITDDDAPILILSLLTVSSIACIPIALVVMYAGYLLGFDVGGVQ